MNVAIKVVHIICFNSIRRVEKVNMLASILEGSRSEVEQSYSLVDDKQQDYVTNSLIVDHAHDLSLTVEEEKKSSTDYDRQVSSNQMAPSLIAPRPPPPPPLTSKIGAAAVAVAGGHGNNGGTMEVEMSSTTHQQIRQEGQSSFPYQTPQNIMMLSNSMTASSMFNNQQSIMANPELLASALRDLNIDYKQNDFFWLNQYRIERERNPQLLESSIQFHQQQNHHHHHQQQSSQFESRMQQSQIISNHNQQRTNNNNVNNPLSLHRQYSEVIHQSPINSPSDGLGGLRHGLQVSSTSSSSGGGSHPPGLSLSPSVCISPPSFTTNQQTTLHSPVIPQRNPTVTTTTTTTTTQGSFSSEEQQLPKNP
jgi:hypothetical protein